MSESIALDTAIKFEQIPKMLTIFHADPKPDPVTLSDLVAEIAPTPLRPSDDQDEWDWRRVAAKRDDSASGLSDPVR
jgi:hypothetical protein